MNRYIPMTLASFVLVAVVLGSHAGIPGARAVAAVRPVPTPTPVAIAYDEINRMAFAQITPPPVGAFGGDYQNIMATVQSGPQAQPQRPHGLGGFLSHAMGLPEGANMQNPMQSMQLGTLKHYTYYWVKGWIRVDDPVAHTAAIYKCREHQTLYLDLVKKTYRIVNDADDSQQAQAPAGMEGNPYAQRMMEPGTATMTVDAKAAALGPKAVEGIKTQGFDSTNALSITNATGSCHDGSFSSRVVEYVAGFGEQRAYCPLPGHASGDAAQYGGPIGGCKPTFTVHHSGTIHPNADRFRMYRMSQFNTAQGQGGAMVMERGHVTWLYNADIPPLFEIPAGFTEQTS
jgi:hypothetical protein